MADQEKGFSPKRRKEKEVPWAFSCGVTEPATGGALSEVAFCPSYRNWTLGDRGGKVTAREPEEWTRHSPSYTRYGSLHMLRVPRILC